LPLLIQLTSIWSVYGLSKPAAQANLRTKRMPSEYKPEEWIIVVRFRKVFFGVTDTALWALIYSGAVFFLQRHVYHRRLSADIK